MKRILIVNNNMKVGGVQKSLYNLLWSIDGQYEITLLLFRATGEYVHSLPANVKVLEADGWFRYLGMSQGECRGLDKLKRGALAALCRVLGRSGTIKLLSNRKLLPTEYDCAIAFLHNGNVKNFYGGVQEFVLHRVRAGKKIAFLHCDYRNCGANHPDNNRLIAQFDRIAACSDGCRQAFISVLPELEAKCITVNNCHRFDEIHAFASEQPVAYDQSRRNIVMVSRLAHEKGIERALEAVAHLAGRGIPADLHLVGGGPMDTTLRELAAKLQITTQVHFYGEQSNPYRYIKNADLFLMSSYHEASPMVIEEALSLGVPVLTTETTSSVDMVTRRNGGWVCANNQEALNEMLAQVLENPALLHDTKAHLQGYAMDNALALRQFTKMIEG